MNNSTLIGLVLVCCIFSVGALVGAGLMRFAGQLIEKANALLINDLKERLANAEGRFEQLAILCAADEGKEFVLRFNKEQRLNEWADTIE